MKKILFCIAAGSAWLSPTVQAADHTHAHAHTVAAVSSAAMTEGTVRKIDKSRGMVTLAHGPIENLGMPGMTMAFKLRNPAAAEGVKVGDKVRFQAESVGGEVVIVRIEAAR